MRCATNKVSSPGRPPPAAFVHHNCIANDHVFATRLPDVDSARAASPHLASLGEDLALWRCVFLRSAGFSVDSLLELGSASCARETDEWIIALDNQAAAARVTADRLRALAADYPPPQCHRLRAAARAVVRGDLPARDGLPPAGVNALLEYAGARETAQHAYDVFLPAHDRACAAAFGVVQRIASDPRFQEAVIWQNRQGFHTAIRPLAEHRATSPSQQARRVALVVSYLQRYCAKNDTIGFFGPVGIAHLASTGDALVVRPGARVLERRQLFFEVWGIQALASTLADRHGLPRMDVPICSTPAAWLRERLREIESETTRTACLDALDAIEAAAAGVRAAAGDPVALDGAFVELERSFTAITGRPATQGLGRMYAARTLVYEDTSRDVRVAMGPQLVDALTPALRVVLHVTRAFTSRFAEAYAEAFERAYMNLTTAGAAPVAAAAIDGLTFWSAAQPLLFGATAQVAGQVFADFRKSWRDLLDYAEGQRDVRLTAANLEQRLDGEFPVAPWVGGIHHSPDVMIAAPDVAAVCRGQFEAVLGEIHAGMNTLSNACFAGQHPDPAELRAALELDIPVTRVVPVLPSYSPRESARTHEAVGCAGDLPLVTGHDGRADAGPTLAASRVWRAPDGTIRVTHPCGPSFAVLDFFAGFLSKVLARTFALTLPGVHTPRVTIDRLVVCRETWRIQAQAVPLIDLRGVDLFRAARTWKRALRLPRYVFVRPPTEVKPFFVDFDSPVFVDLLARALRRAADASAEPTVVSEMLPRPDQLWLVDREGRRYTSELRMVAVDLEVRRRVLETAQEVTAC